MHGFWSGIAEAESAAVAASSGANALYFAQRVVRSSGVRRLSAAILTGVFMGVALDGATHLGDHANAAVEAVLRAPLLIATLATNAVLALAARR